MTTENDIRNIAATFASNVQGAIQKNDVRESNMSDALISPYGWRQMGLFLAGGARRSSVEFATINGSGTIVGA